MEFFVKSQPMEEPTLLQQLRDNPASRRSFLKTMGAAGLGLAAISLLNGCGGGNDNNNGGNTGSFPLQNLPGTGDQKILNYALTLELLEADLYRQALNLATGKPLTTPLASSPSAYTRTVGGGGLDTFNTEAGFAYLRYFAFIEAAHVLFLQAALQGNAVARNAKGYSFGRGVTVAADIKSILTAILPLEETGVRAYLGAGQYFQSNSLLQTAVTIYSTEARHSSAINYILGIDPGPNRMTGDLRVQTFGSENTFEYFLEPGTVVNRITSSGLIVQ